MVYWDSMLDTCYTNLWSSHAATEEKAHAQVTQEETTMQLLETAHATKSQVSNNHHTAHLLLDSYSILRLPWTHDLLMWKDRSTYYKDGSVPALIFFLGSSFINLSKVNNQLFGKVTGWTLPENQISGLKPRVSLIHYFYIIFHSWWVF